MDTESNGSQPCRAIMEAIALMLVAALVGCAQPHAAAQNTPDVQDAQEKPMQGVPTREDAQAEGDRVARELDDIARELSGSPNDPGPAPEPMPLPEGPPMSANAMEAGIVQLALALRGSAQTEPEFVGKTLGITLQPDAQRKWVGLQGPAGAGRYAVEVGRLYPGTPGKHVSVQLRPGDGSTCSLDFERVVEKLEQAGYAGSKGPPGMDPHYTYSRQAGALKGFVGLTIGNYQAPCIQRVTFDLEAKDV